MPTLFCYTTLLVIQGANEKINSERNRTYYFSRPNQL
jgi:hypothetical protein